MITINGQKMGKSYGNFINLDEFFNGTHKLLTQAYSPMTIRFFILQAHYRSTIDFSNEALQAAEKGLKKLLESYNNIDKKLKESGHLSTSLNDDSDERWVQELKKACKEAMDDDLNTPMVIAHLFGAARQINSDRIFKDSTLKDIKEIFKLYLFDILGLREENNVNEEHEISFDKVVDMLLEQRMKAKSNKDWATSDKIRNELTALGFTIKDTKDGCEWELNK